MPKIKIFSIFNYQTEKDAKELTNKINKFIKKVDKLNKVESHIETYKSGDSIVREMHIIVEYEGNVKKADEEEIDNMLPK